MARRSRILAFGACAVLVVAGTMCAVLLDGFTGEVLTLALLGLGLVGAVALVFLEIGLSEDRERARGERRRKPPKHGRETEPPPRFRRRPRRPG
jgi:hypothetical protein